VRQLVEPLAAHDDQRRGGALLETLEVYLRSGLNRAASARRLHLHPNSLDLCLQRVQQLTETDLHSVRDIARLWLALRARQATPG
jgi:DNA-binding PucR family transcriptional regulator